MELTLHPTPAEIAGLIAGQLPPVEAFVVARHLSGGCRVCRQAWRLRPPLPAAYRRPRRAQVRRVLALLEEQGPAAFRGLPRHLRGAAAFEALLERSWILRFDDPRQMAQLAELAVAIAGGAGAGRIRDAQCRAAVELANAYRANRCLAAAQTALDEAMEHFCHGSLDPLLEARLLEVQGNLLATHGSRIAAAAAFDAALAIYRREGRTQLAGRVLVTKAMFAVSFNQDQEALSLLAEADELIEPPLDPPLALAAAHNAALALARSGRYREAQRLLWRHLPLYERHGGALGRARLRWLQGLIYVGIGEGEQAVAAFLDGRQGFVDAGDPYTASIIDLDCAALLERRGEAERARLMALQAADRFLELDLGREAGVAMMLLKTSLKFRVATTAVPLDRMASFMEAAELDARVSLHDFLSDPVGAVR
ncbi:MAG TPA: hypothetical protein VHR45_12950 [Thermoanaerobaculia bacterium]|nr:hypothetical protein [Thermoanaerobaculia bacterium]